MTIRNVWTKRFSRLLIKIDFIDKTPATNTRTGWLDVTSGAHSAHEHYCTGWDCIQCHHIATTIRRTTIPTAREGRSHVEAVAFPEASCKRTNFYRPIAANIGLNGSGRAWFGVAVTAFVTSTKLSYVEPG